MQTTGRNIEIAANYIKEGKLVAFPTETVYGLGANALDPLAVAKIFEMKERPSFDPLIVHIAEKADIDKLTSKKDERIYQITDRFWPGPLTLILPKSEIVPDIVTAGLPTLGIRMPDNEMALELIRKAEYPIAAPSANKFGRISPTNADHVKKQLPGVDYILDGGNTKVGIESTIIAITGKGFQILRNGIITREELEQILPYDETSHPESTVAPGMLSIIDKSKAGYLSFSGSGEKGYKRVIRLTKTSDLKEYAVNLFAAMHALEESDVETIVAEPVPETGIGVAIMDRLRKAAWRE
ncbi:MAG: L-threonylcarbamoyladenylate synthase [Prolixibacteraceae bacterium]